MDPFTLPVVALATQILRNIEQAQIACNTAPEEYRKHFYERLDKYEGRADRLLDLCWGHIEKALPPSGQAK